MRAEFTPYSEGDRQKVKQSLGFGSNRPLVVITGGGLGARRINMAVASAEIGRASCRERV